MQHTYVCKMSCGSSPLALHPADAAQVATAIATRSKERIRGVASATWHRPRSGLRKKKKRRRRRMRVTKKKDKEDGWMDE